MTAGGGEAVPAKTKGSLKTQESQPRMDAQFVADNIDYLEVTKKKKRIAYEPLPDDSMRSGQNDASSLQGSQRGSARGTKGMDAVNDSHSRNGSRMDSHASRDSKMRDSTLPAIGQQRSVSKQGHTVRD